MARPTSGAASGGATAGASRAAAGAAGGPLLAAAILLIALNMRAPIVAVSPVVDAIRGDLGVSSGVAGLLTSLPVLAFAVASGPASWMVGRLGPERAMLVGLGVLALGTVLRSADGVASALAGTALIGAGITVGNIVGPVVIGRDFPHRSGGLLGAYTATMNIGSMITLSITVPLADGVGWRLALLAWLAVALAAAIVWRVATRGRGAAPGAAAHPDDDGSHAVRPPWRRPVGWLLLVAFGTQAFSYYGLTAWLPEILGELRGLAPATAGVASSLFQVMAVVGALGVPVLRARTGSLRAAFVPVALGWLALPVGLLLAPAAWPLWTALGGVAQGGGFTVYFATVLAVSATSADNRRLGAFMQVGAYSLGSLGPFVAGAVHEATAVDGWTVPLVGVAAVLTGLAVSGWLATGAAPRRPARS